MLLLQWGCCWTKGQETGLWLWPCAWCPPWRTPGRGQGHRAGWGRHGGALRWVSRGGLCRRAAWRCGLGRGMGEQVNLPRGLEERGEVEAGCADGQALVGLCSEAPGAGGRWAGGGSGCCGHRRTLRTRRRRTGPTCGRSISRLGTKHPARGPLLLT